MRSEIEEALARLAQQERVVRQLQSDYATIVRSRFYGIRAVWHGLKSAAGAGKLNARDVRATRALPSVPSTAAQPAREARIERLAATWRTRNAEHPLSDAPLVTIVIPVMNHLDVTIRCLQSICDVWFATLPVQIVLVDDGSDDGAGALAERLPGLDFVRNGRNKGFVHACNRGAALSSARYVYFLNNDTTVRNGWLDALISTLEDDPSIGAAGSKLLYPDGSLQEAGGIIFQDGTGWNYGRGGDPADARYGHVRDVDYCSAASLIVRREIFERIGGFDAGFAPAYYEDADLCFTIRSLGYRVVYQPRSVVVHDEGTTSGNDTTSGAKRYQERNRPRFIEKWHDSLRGHCEPGAHSVAFAARRLRRGQSILVIDSYVPLHDKEAGSNRLFAILKMFVALGYHVMFLPDNYAGLQPYTTQLQEMGIEVLYHVHGGRSMEQALDEIVPLLDAAWICRPELFTKYESSIRRNAQTKIIYDTIDLHYVRLKRRSELLGESDDAWKRSQRLELDAARAADLTITVTEQERGLLTAAGIENVDVIPTIYDVSPRLAGPFESTAGLLFIGGYNHLPNRDAASWLCSEVMPLVWRTLPDLTVTLLGSEPDEATRALASGRVFVPGYIHDVEPYFTRSRVFVAPLRFGAGHKGKIGHSLSYGLPVVSTPIGIEGYGLVDGRDCIVAETAPAFADAIARLYTNRVLWESLAAASVAAVAPFGSANVQSGLRSMMRRLLAEV